ncbi:cytochrome P450 [Streptomyces sp. NPDC056479]
MSTNFVNGTAPRALPLVGHAIPLMRRPVEFLDSLPAYGDLVEIRLGPTRAYVPCHPELLRQVLMEDRVFDKGGPLFDRLRDIVGNGLGSCPHRDHRRQRRLLQPAFHRARLQHYADVMEQESTVLTESWQEGQVIDAFPVLYGFALRTATRTLFTAHVDDGDVETIQRSFETALGGLFQRMFLPRAWQRLPLPANRRYQQALDHLHGRVDRIIADYRRGGQNHGDLLSMLMSARDEDGGATLNDDEVHDQVITMLFGGSETVAANLTWTLYLMSRHPEAARKVHEETDAVLEGRPAGWSDLPELPFTNRMITESLRLYPPAWLYTRITASQVELAGRRLEPGTTLVISPPVVHRQASVHADPTDFSPDRWLPDRTADLPRGSFATFGAGARKCIGDAYALAEATLALATIANRWQVECDPGTDVRPSTLATVMHPRRLHLRLARRTTKTARHNARRGPS